MRSDIVAFWNLLFDFLNSGKWRVNYNEKWMLPELKGFTVIDTSPSLMKGKQHEHTYMRPTVVCTRAEYTSSPSSLQTLPCLRRGVRGLALYTLEIEMRVGVRGSVCLFSQASFFIKKKQSKQTKQTVWRSVSRFVTNDIWWVCFDWGIWFAHPCFRFFPKTHRSN